MLMKNLCFVDLCRTAGALKARAELKYFRPQLITGVDLGRKATSTKLRKLFQQTPRNGMRAEGRVLYLHSDVLV